MAQRLIEVMMSEIAQDTKDTVQGEIYCLSSMYPHENAMEHLHILAYKDTSDPDTMYLHQP